MFDLHARGSEEKNLGLIERVEVLQLARKRNHDKADEPGKKNVRGFRSHIH